MTSRRRAPVPSETPIRGYAIYGADVYRRQTTVGRMRPRGSFVVAALPQPNRRVHLVARTVAIWSDAALMRVAASAWCGQSLTSAVVLSDAPADLEMCDDCLLVDLSGHCVYRFTDEAGAPVYIGYTENVWMRMRAHKCSSSWWPLVRGCVFTSYADKASALAAEKAAIVAEDPPMNREHTGRVVRRRRSPSVRHAVEVFA